MSKQLRLFDPRIPPWVRRLWECVDPEMRRQVLVILAGMARSTLSTRVPPKRKEVADESS